MDKNNVKLGSRRILNEKYVKDLVTFTIARQRHGAAYCAI